MTGISPDVVHLSGGNLVLVIVVALIALGALAVRVLDRPRTTAMAAGGLPLERATIVSFTAAAIAGSRPNRNRAALRTSSSRRNRATGR